MTYLRNFPVPVTFDHLIDDLLRNDIILLGEDGHGNINLLEKEIKIIEKLKEKSNHPLVFALEYLFPKFEERDISNYYIKELVDSCSKVGKIEGIRTGNKNPRGLRMAEMISKLSKNYPDSKIVAIVGDGHIKVSGIEIPTYLKNEMPHKKYARVSLKISTTVDDKILEDLDIHGKIYFF